MWVRLKLPYTDFLTVTGPANLPHCEMAPKYRKHRSGLEFESPLKQTPRIEARDRRNASPVRKKMPPFKLDHVILIAPGSRYVNAQMGVGESPTPPRFRFPSRMFPTDTPDRYEPVKIHARKRVKLQSDGDQEQTNGVKPETTVNGTTEGEQKPVDTEMTDAATHANGATTTTAETTAPDPVPSGNVAEPSLEMEEYFEEDPDSDEGAIWPIVEGRIENHSCFFALLTQVWQSMNPNFNSPVIIVAQPAWTTRDYENITRLVFQTWASPALHIADAASVALYGVGAESAVVVDVGYEKCDITPIYQSLIEHPARRISLKNCGGRAMTQKLQRLLEKQGFDEDMAEQLKKSNICEILPPGAVLPGASNSNGNPAAAASTGATTSGASAKEADGMRPGQAPRGPGAGTEAGEEDDNEGVLDIASIVARDNAAELLAKREAEKAAKAASKKGGAQEASRQVRLKNSEKETATFTYNELLPLGAETNGDLSNGNRVRKREIEVGVERLMAAEPLPGEYEGILETIAWNIRGAIMSVSNLPARPALWDNLVVCGNGSRVKGESFANRLSSGMANVHSGFKDALYAILVSKYKLSPSTATIFTSELPSNFSTPVATPGTNTPIPGQGGHPMHHPAGHGVNPLLLAATRNVMQPNQAHHLQVPGHSTPLPDPSTREGRPVSQTPSSIKYAKLPDYIPEWKTPEWINFEEASFAGVQVLAQQLFGPGASRDESQRMFLLRTEFNDEGPPGIANYCLGWA